jgi:hypothetical protein
VVSEILKARAHRGLPPSLSCFRDRKGAAVDAVLETGQGMIAAETKSGRTVAADFVTALRRLCLRSSAPADTRARYGRSSSMRWKNASSARV